MQISSELISGCDKLRWNIKINLLGSLWTEYWNDQIKITFCCPLFPVERYVRLTAVIASRRMDPVVVLWELISYWLVLLLIISPVCVDLLVLDWYVPEMGSLELGSIEPVSEWLSLVCSSLRFACVAFKVELFWWWVAFSKLKLAFLLAVAISGSVRARPATDIVDPSVVIS